MAPKDNINVVRTMINELTEQGKVKEAEKLRLGLRAYEKMVLPYRCITVEILVPNVESTHEDLMDLLSDLRDDHHQTITQYAILHDKEELLSRTGAAVRFDEPSLNQEEPNQEPQ